MHRRLDLKILAAYAYYNLKQKEHKGAEISQVSLSIEHHLFFRKTL